MLTIDTNVLIAYLGGEERVIQAIQQWRSQGIVLFLSAVTECELLSYPKLSSQEEEKIERFLKENFISFPFDGQLAREAATIRRNMPTLKLPDAAIASLARKMKIPLVTRNIRDFRKVSNLLLREI